MQNKLYDGIHWDPRHLLPYQRNFNFIASTRNIGKTFGTQIFCMKDSIEKENEFVYLVRYKSTEKDVGAMEKAFEKVCDMKFPEYEFNWTNEEVTLEGQTIGHCIALTEAEACKKKSFPKVKNIIFDEYILDTTDKRRYVGGMNEPEALLKIYHSIDREEDRVRCFLLGNTIEFYNPYHVYPAFNIPLVKPGKIWYSENVLFEYALPSDKLQHQREGSKFLRMISGTKYGNYAKDSYFEDSTNAFIEKRSKAAKHMFVIQYKGQNFGIWQDLDKGVLFVDNVFDLSCGIVYALTLEDHTENTLLTKNKTCVLLRYLADNFQRGTVRFTSQKVRASAIEAIKTIL